MEKYLDHLLRLGNFLLDNPDVALTIVGAAGTWLGLSKAKQRRLARVVAAIARERHPDDYEAQHAHATNLLLGKRRHHAQRAVSRELIRLQEKQDEADSVKPTIPDYPPAKVQIPGPPKLPPTDDAA